MALNQGLVGGGAVSGTESLNEHWCHGSLGPKQELSRLTPANHLDSLDQKEEKSERRMEQHLLIPQCHF